MIRELREKVGMEKKITPHSFRHGFGYRGVRANANLRYLQIMMGHAKLSTTQTYMGYKDKEVEEEYRRVMETGRLHDLGKTGSIVAYAEQQTGTTREKGEELGDSQQVPKRLYFEGLGQTLRFGFHYHQTSGVPIRQKAEFKDRP